MQVARLTFAAQRRSDRPFRIFPLTIYEANFREKLTKNFQKFSFPFGRPDEGHGRKGRKVRGQSIRLRRGLGDAIGERGRRIAPFPQGRRSQERT